MDNELIKIIVMIVVAAASGFVGVFALMRKMTLASDAISHVALPGLGLALVFKINPLIGGGVALLLGVALIWFIEQRTKISTETVIGVVFSTSLALGSLITPSEDLLEAFLGSGGEITFIQGVVGIIASLLVIIFILHYKEKLTLSLVSEDLAIASQISVSKMNLYFLLAFALNVILGLQFLGVLLMGSLIIVPAAVGRNLGKSLGSTMAISLVTAIGSVVSGYLISTYYGFALGPVIISVASITFFLSFFFVKK